MPRDPDRAGRTFLGRKDAADNAAIKKEWESWNAPFQPFRLIGNIHYVGTSGISSFLITTPEGHMLLDTGFEMTGTDADNPMRPGLGTIQFLPADRRRNHLGTDAE